MTTASWSGPTGSPRCSWAGTTPEYLAYHDDEWGVPVHGETALFERFTLEAFQSGLSWITILRKRPAFRDAFAGFDAERSPRSSTSRPRPADGRRGDRPQPAKIDAAITNARAVLRLRAAGGLDEVLWSFAPTHHTPPGAPRGRSARPPRARSPSPRRLKGHGFVFVGPTTTYAAMQACGVVDDHLRGCHRSTAR